MSCFWEDADGNFWESPRANDDDRPRGRCTGVPECCIDYFIAGGRAPEGLDWEYVPCPECIRTGNRITPKLCVELKDACTCGTWANRRPLELDDEVPVDDEQGDYVEMTTPEGHFIRYRRGSIAYGEGI